MKISGKLHNPKQIFKISQYDFCYLHSIVTLTWWWLYDDLLMTRTWLDSDLMTWTMTYWWVVHDLLMTCWWLAWLAHDLIMTWWLNNDLLMTHISGWNLLNWLCLTLSMHHFCSWNVKFHKMKSAKLTMPWIRYALFMKCHMSQNEIC